MMLRTAAPAAAVHLRCSALCRAATALPHTATSLSPRLPSGHTRAYSPSSQGGAERGSGPRWPSTPNPTPYDIFDQTRGAPYSKQRFYELVKLYHPDRHAHAPSDGIPRATKLERYRLVVAANTILCDPERRRLYDRYGAGWAGLPDMGSSHRSADQRWRQEPGNASMNATWEDWERWYQARDGQKQEPIFVSNGGFVAIVVVLALVGGWGHFAMAGHQSADLLDMRDQQHVMISKEMRQRQNLYAHLSKEDRVQNFLRQRDGWEYEPPSCQARREEKPAPS